MTLAMKLEDVRRTSLREGREAGRQEGVKETVSTLRKSLSVVKIARLLKLSEQAVEEILKPE